MKAWFVVILAGLLAIAGCGTYDRTASIQQEKLLIDLMKSQNDQLVQVMQRETDLRELARKNDDAIQEIERQRTALRAQRQEAASKDQAAKEAMAKEEAKLQAERDGLAAKQNRLRVAEVDVQRREQELAAKEAAFRSRMGARPEPRVALRPIDAAHPTDQERTRAEVQARITQRQPYLDELATITANLFAPGMARSTVRAEVLKLLTESKVAELREDDAFADDALRIVERYYLDKTRYPYMTHEKQVFDQWAQAYLKHEHVAAKAS